MIISDCSTPNLRPWHTLCGLHKLHMEGGDSVFAHSYMVFLACQKEQLREKHRNAGQKVLRQTWYRSVLREKLINMGRR